MKRTILWIAVAAVVILVVEIGLSTYLKWERAGNAVVIASVSASQSVQPTPPPAKMETPSPRPIIISVDANEVLYVGSNSIEYNELKATIANIRNADFYVRGDINVRYEGIGRVLNAMQSNSVNTVRLNHNFDPEPYSTHVAISGTHVNIHPVKLLPHLVGTESVDHHPIAFLVIDFDGTLAWSGEPVADRQALRLKLEDFANQSAQSEVRIVPNKLCKFGGVVQLIFDAEQAGIRNVTVAGIRDYSQ